MREKITNIILFFISIYIPIILCECYFLFSSNLSQKSSLSKKVINQNKIFNNEKELARLEGYVPTYFPDITKNYEKDLIPIGGKVNSKTYFCNEGYGLIKYKSDRFGLRNQDSKWDLIKSNKYSLFIGDSFVHGACVKREKTIPYIFEKKTNQVALNLGYGGNNPYNYIFILNSFADRLIKMNKTNANIILVFYQNDICKNCKIDENHIKKITLKNKPIQENKVYPNKLYLKKLDMAIEKAEKSSPKFLNASYKKDTLPIIYAKNIYRTLVLKNFREKLFELNNRIDWGHYYNYKSPSATAIKTLSKICKKNCTPYVAYIPKRNFNYEKDINTKYRNALRKFSNFYNVNYIDLTNTINPKNKLNYAPLGGHLSELGYKLVSEEISKQINK